MLVAAAFIVASLIFLLVLVAKINPHVYVFDQILDAAKLHPKKKQRAPSAGVFAKKVEHLQFGLGLVSKDKTSAFALKIVARFPVTVMFRALSPCVSSHASTIINGNLKS